jgi:ATP adenylyltransferase
VSDCVFCHVSTDRVFLTNDLAFAMWDGFPVTRLHALIVPHRHTPDYFSLTVEELVSCHELLHKVRERVRTDDPLVDGFNIGANLGESAGQTIFHCHIHLIPRRRGDVENPRGGVRHLIPGKGAY